VKKVIFVGAFVALLFSLAVAQDIQQAPVTANLNVVRGSQGAAIHTPGAPPFCKGTSCLYYAGDFDSSASGANGLFNADYTAASEEGQVWVGVKPTKAATVTGTTFNMFLSSGYTGTNPTPFQTQVGIKPGTAGKTVCNTSGTAVIAAYGEGDFGYTQYSYTVKKLKKACKVRVGKKGATYVNLLPTSANGYGYLVDVEDAKPANHHGWKNDVDDSYFNSATFSVVYELTSGSSGACAGTGCDEFSIALTGKY
jgi:hypothetical protein